MLILPLTATKDYRSLAVGLRKPCPKGPYRLTLNESVAHLISPLTCLLTIPDKAKLHKLCPVSLPTREFEAKVLPFPGIPSEGRNHLYWISVVIDLKVKPLVVLGWYGIYLKTLPRSRRKPFLLLRFSRCLNFVYSLFTIAHNKTFVKLCLKCYITYMNVLTENKKAHFNYEILERFQAGLVLQGLEVKSARLGRIQIAGSYGVFKQGELFLIGATISSYQPNNTPLSYKSERSRKLLLNKKELSYLEGKVKERGLTLVPLKVYSTGEGRIKLEFGLAKGKKKWDKREALKNKDSDREIERALRKN